MDVTNANLDLIFRAANLRFNGAVSKTETVANQIATTFPSSTRQETYAWPDRLPRMRKWFGPRVINSVNTHAQTVVNMPFEDTIGLNRRDVQDDVLGIFNASVDGLGMQAALWPDRELADFITTANTLVGYDGANFYSTSHPISGGDVQGGPTGNQSNLLVNTALTFDNYVAARVQMMSWVGFDGSPLGITPDILMVPPALEGIGKLILESDFAANINGNASAPQSNTYKGTAKLLVNKFLANKPNNWWLLSTTNVVKPFLWQLRKSPVFTMLTNPNDPNVFLNNQFLYGIDSEGAASGTLWFLSLAATSAGSY